MTTTSAPAQHSVILDVDTGIDDAMAVLYALHHPDIEVRAITCVAGNVDLPQVLDNTLALLELAGAPQIPVAGGAEQPLIGEARSAAWIHGSDGVGGIALPRGVRSPEPVRAVELLRRTLMESEKPLTIITLAPLTNIALLLRAHPEVTPRIARIVTMGGSASVGNASATAEFNVWHDPEAAHIVFTSGIPLTMYGLDVFDRIRADDAHVAALRQNDPVQRALAGLLSFTVTVPGGDTIVDNRRIGDAGAVIALTNPELFTFESYPVHVELAPSASRGATIVDRRPHAAEDAVHGARGAWPVLDIALQADIDAVLSTFFAVFPR